MDEIPQPVVLTPEPGVVHLGALGTHLRARDFLAVAQLAGREERQFTPVASFLYCRAIELCLKAYLVSRGTSLDDLRSLGHDLEHLLIDAFARGLDVITELTPEERAAIVRANELYHGNKLAYFDLWTSVAGRSNHPTDDVLANVAAKLHSATEHGCMAATDGPWTPLERAT